MYICDELMDKVYKSEIAEFLKENGIDNPNDERYPKDRKKMLELLVSEGNITEETLSEFFYTKIMCGEHRLMRVYKLSDRSSNLLREKTAWESFMDRYQIKNLKYNLILTQLKHRAETIKLIYVKVYRDKLKRMLSRIDMIYAFKILKYNRYSGEVDKLNSYLPVSIDLVNKEIIIKVCNQTGLVETSRPKIQMNMVFDELQDILNIELDGNKVRPENVLYDMSRDLFNNFYKQLPNIEEIDKKKENLDRIVDMLLQDIKLNFSFKDKNGLLHIDEKLIDLEDELYKLLQQTALIDYLETEDLTTLLPEDEIYISKIRFSDQDNLEASLTGENGMDCIYDKRTFMGIRNSLDIVKRIFAMRVIFPQEKSDLSVKYEVTGERYIIVHILDGKHYNLDEFKEAWELYRKYEKQRINKRMLGKYEKFETTAM
nr:hypothetical protein [uncultured Agathobacter sp.]